MSLLCGRIVDFDGSQTGASEGQPLIFVRLVYQYIEGKNEVVRGAVERWYRICY
jgi:hypothetical protein